MTELHAMQQDAPSLLGQRIVAVVMTRHDYAAQRVARLTADAVSAATDDPAQTTPAIAELRAARYRELVTLRSNLFAMRAQIQRAKHRGASN